MKNQTPFELFQFCPKCGVKGFHKSGANFLECDACGFVFYINPVVTAIALIKNDQGKILLTRRRVDPGKGKLDFPGGFADLNESIEMALIREIKEELNLIVSNVSYFGSYPNEYPFKGLFYYPVDVAFNCDIADWNDLTVGDDVEDIEFRLPGAINKEELAFADNARIIDDLTSLD